jgi:uncharacterized OsmC-like protein
MSDSEGSFVITLEQQKDFQFLVKWDNPNVPELLVDEAAPLGEDAGPNPSRILSLAVANCLSASLLFALRKFKNQPEPLKATVTTQMVRNEKNRLRVGKITVDIQMGAAAADLQHLERVLAQFEDFCVVKESVRSGFAVDVTVRDGSGVIVKQP